MPSWQLVMEESGGGAPRLSLNLPLRDVRTSLLSLAVAADNVTFVVNRAPAAIEGVQVGRAWVWVARLPARPLAC